MWSGRKDLKLVAMVMCGIDSLQDANIPNKVSWCYLGCRSSHHHVVCPPHQTYLILRDLIELFGK